MKQIKENKQISNIRFTRRETNWLFLLSKNFLPKEIANNLSVSSRTIEFYLKSIIMKLNHINKISGKAISSNKKISYIENKRDKLIRLTKREYQCVKYLVAGYTAKQTALNLRISPKSVESY